MTKRELADRVGLVLVLAVAVFLGVRAHLERGVVQLSKDAALVARQLTPTDSVSTSGVDQRYRVQRDAVTAMRADLLRYARAESTFLADSGYPRVTFSPGSPYSVRLAKGNFVEGFRVGPPELTTTMWSTVTTIKCSITLPYSLDTAYRPPHVILSPVREPVCTQSR